MRVEEKGPCEQHLCAVLQKRPGTFPRFFHQGTFTVSSSRVSANFTARFVTLPGTAGKAK
eukprot:12927194-Prorocentrum_lima.AAC.1